MSIYKKTLFGNWVIARIGPEIIDELMPLSIEHTSKKVANSMDQGQDGVIRTQDVKFQKQLMGTLAEKATAKYLELILKKHEMQDDWRTVVYDDVRPDFTYSIEEYDLKIVSQSVENHKQVFFESRSSIIYDRPFEDAMRNFHIIGPYSSDSKTTELLRDFYARPLYFYTDFATQKYLPSQFQDLVNQRKVILYIVGGCTKQEMEGRGYFVNMNQGNTSYRGVNILDGHDAEGFGQMVIKNLAELKNS